MSRRVVMSVVASIALATAALTAVGGPAVAGGGGSTPQIPRIASVRPMVDVGVHRGNAQPASTTAAGLKFFSRTVTDGASSFTYKMVGKNPFVAQVNASTTVKTPVVPLIVKFVDGTTWDPTVGSSCDTTSAVTRVMSSPMVKPVTWTFGGTSVGKGQYSDAFQRASFYAQTKPTGINPGYHVKLSYLLQPAMTVTVPATKAAFFPTSCGNGKLAAVDIDWLDGYLTSTALPALAAAGFGPSTFPLFLTNNVVEYIGTVSQCCVLGYHSATGAAPGGQTYSISEYDNSGAFGAGVSDVSILSHEVSEWVNDPFVDNATQPWGNIGQVSGCQSNLEVGDPLTGTTFPVTLNGKTYQMQEMAFVSWFYHQSPSSGVNGWYSNQGTFTSGAAPCP